MAIATEQLEAINQDISQSFSYDPRISIVPVDGTPPDKYEITYNVEGLQKTDSGAIEKTSSHTIVISIPFGFPHFPPSCKPKSPIFHPDFDPAAICIGDFWEKNRSIVGLISHIGEMITGAIYSTSNAFNEEAAQWYTDNFSQSDGNEQSVSTDVAAPVAPALETDSKDEITSLLEDDDDLVLENDLLESFDPSAEDSVEPALSFTDEPAAAGDDSSADSPGDIFQESDFDFEEPQKTEPPEDDELLPPGFKSDLAGEIDEDDVDLDHFQELVDQKRFFGLDRELSLLSDGTVFEGREALVEQSAVALEQAQSLYTQALELEHKGDPAAALKCFKQIETHTTDYPGLQEDISRMTQALELLGDWAGPTDKKPAKTIETKAKPDYQEPPSPPPPPRPSQPGPAPQESESRTFFEDEAKQKSRLVLYALGLVVFLIAAAVGVNYYLSSSKFGQAQHRYDDCLASLEKNQFSEAELQCESALGLAKQINLFRSADRDLLIGKVQKTLRSEPLKQGLAGNMLVDGQYYPRQVVQNIVSFREFKQKGDKLFASSNWQQSVSNYEQAQKIAAQEKAIDQKELFEISENIKTAQFNILYQSGISFFDRKKWVHATKDLTEALEQLKTLSIPDKASLVDVITARLGEIEQATEKEKGDIAFAESKWTQASAYYRKALAAAKQSDTPDDNAINELKQLVVKGDLYTIISTGKTAFRQAQWDAAINSYDQAISLLEDNRELLKQANTDENRKKLARIMLQASIIRDKQNTARHLKEKEYNEAIEKLETILNSISASGFKSEPEFVTIQDETKQAIKQAGTDKLLADKITYLEDNFEELFTKHYTSSPPESLVDRRVVFEKKIDSKLLFRLQCVEVGRGRPLQQVMKYTHDLNSGEWNFYSDSQ